jgi:hypothetical protein
MVFWSLQRRRNKREESSLIFLIQSLSHLRMWRRVASKKNDRHSFWTPFTLEGGTDRLFRNVGKQLSSYAA